MRPLRGGQGTFDKIIETSARSPDQLPRSRSAATSTRSSVDSYPALLDFLREQEFADKLAKVAFKPIIREPKPQQPKGFIPLTAVGVGGQAAERHLHDVGGRRRVDATARATRATSSTTRCRSCARRRRKRGFKTVDGVHMGPCEIHKQHAHTIGPDGSLYACPGFAGNVARVDRPHRRPRRTTGGAPRRERFEKITAWKDCDDCAFIPVCAGGCSVAAHTELGDMNKPNCHKPSFEAGVVTLAHQAARQLAHGVGTVSTLKQWIDFGTKGATNVNGKKDTKKKGTLRPWLVDVSLDHLR